MPTLTRDDELGVLYVRSLAEGRYAVQFSFGDRRGTGSWRDGLWTAMATREFSPGRVHTARTPARALAKARRYYARLGFDMDAALVLGPDGTEAERRRAERRGFLLDDCIRRYRQGEIDLDTFERLTARVLGAATPTPQLVRDPLP